MLETSYRDKTSDIIEEMTFGVCIAVSDLGPQKKTKYGKSKPMKN